MQWVKSHPTKMHISVPKPLVLYNALDLERISVKK